MPAIRVLEVRTYPRKGEPAVGHDEVRVTSSGLVGDRPRRAAVSLVGRDAPTTRANLVLDATTADLEALDGSVVRVGEVLLAVQRTGNACPGLYASVGEEGRLAVGDGLEVLAEGAA